MNKDVEKRDVKQQNPMCIKITQTSNADMNIGLPMKQTAVNWLVEQILKEKKILDLDIEQAINIVK